MQTEEIVSKSEFARRCKVSPGRVSQWLSEGKITSQSIGGDGRLAKIRVASAMRELDAKLDPSQRTGNGIGTEILIPTNRPPAAKPDQSSSPEENEPRPVSASELLAEEKLKQARLTNRRLAEEELLRRGIYTKSADVIAGYRTIAESMLREFEGALPDLATAMSSQFEIPHRDVLHLLKQEMRKIRTKAAASAKTRAAELPASVVDASSDSGFDLGEEGKA